MSRKSKGINAERELIHLFWKYKWAACRVAGSGSSRYPSPDVLAGNGARQLAIECKASKNSSKYLTSKEIMELREFSILYGAEAWVGIRFDKMEWYFLALDELKKTGKSYSATVDLVKRKALTFEELIGNF